VDSQNGFCHLHAAQLSGQPNGQPFVPKQLTIEERLQQLMNDPDKRIRLRAIDAYRKLLDGCPTCQARTDSYEKQEEAFRRLTPDQRDRLLDILQEMRAILDAALNQPVYVAPVDPLPPPAPEPQPVFYEVPEPAPELEAVTIVIDPGTLPKSEWASVGIVMENGVPTCADGDEEAAAIICGDIDYETAREQHITRQKTRGVL
jgi:hypothetical protein